MDPGPSFFVQLELSRSGILIKLQDPWREKMKFKLNVLLITICLLPWGQAYSTAPDLWGVLEWPHTETVQLMVTPGGNGPTFDEASYFGGISADATLRIQIWIQDGSSPFPLVGFPGEDIWLEAPGLVPCIGGSSAEGDTDTQGWVTFINPLRMGGWMDPEGEPQSFRVMLSGDWLRDETGGLLAPGMVLNSPDINGDLVIDLGDLGLFATDFFGAYNFRSDFFWDGVLNLADVGRLAASFGDQCP